MIVAGFIGVLFVAALYYAWIDLGDLRDEVAGEVGAGRVDRPGTVTSYGLTADATGADDWFGDAA